MFLDNRLRCVVNEIADSKAVIDVGSDHGKVIITALLEGRTKRGIASDISANSLQKASTLADRIGVSLVARVGDGLSVLNADDEVDTCVIAGMGGKEIVKILSDYSGKIEKLILVPHKDSVLTREYLASNGYAISKDYVVKEGNFFYNIIVALVGEMVLLDRQKYLGLNSLANKDFCDYLNYRKNYVSSILAKAKNEDLQSELTQINIFLKGN